MGPAALSSRGARHQIRQLPGALDPAATALALDRRGEAPRARLLAVFPQYSRQLGRRVFIHDRGGVERLAPVHPHVERRVGLKAEAALGRVDVLRRDAEIEDGAVHAPPADLPEDGPGGAEIGAPDDRPGAESCEPLSRRGDRLVVPIQPQDFSVRGAPLEYFYAVP